MRPATYNPRSTSDSVHNYESGFSLVELAIALMVIGLLIAAFLKGNEVLDNARINKTIRDLQGVEAAIVSFKETYGYLPGDIPNPAEVLPDCSWGGNCLSGGNGDGIVGAAETSWRIQLARAGLFALSQRGGLVKNYSLTSGGTGSISHMGHILRGDELIRPKAMDLIDRKMDDGFPSSGRVRPSSFVSCTVGDLGGAYNNVYENNVCTIAYLLQY